MLGLLQAAAQSGPVTIRWQPLNEPGSGGWLTGLAISPHDAQRLLIGGDLLGAGLSEDGGLHWQSTFGFKSWEMADFTWHPTNAQEVWVGTMSGPYVSRDGGRTWTEKRTGFPALSGGNYSCPIQKVLFDPTNARHLLAFGGSHRGYSGPGTSQWGAVWESTNGGEAWTQLGQVGNGSFPGVMNATFVAGSSAVLLAALAGQRVMKSTDGGKTWNPANTGLPAADVTWLSAHPTDPNLLYLSTESYQANGSLQPGLVCRSTNGGASWQPITQGLYQTKDNNAALCSHYKVVAVAPSNPRVLYTADMSYWPLGLFRSDDGGDTWRVVLDGAKKAQTPTAFVAGPAMTMLTVDTHNPDHVLAAGSEYVLRTTTGGQAWEDVTSGPASNGTFRGRGFSGLVTTAVRFNPYQKDHAVLLGLDDGKFWQSRDALQTWTWGGQNLPHWGGGNDVTFAGPAGAVLYVSFGQFGSYGGIGKTTDGGKTWTIVPESAFPGLSGDKVATGVYALPANPDKVWAVVGGRLYRSENGGTTWVQALPNATMGWIAAQKNAPSTFYVSSQEGVYRTTDGSAFTLLPGSPTNATRLRADPTNDQRLYATAWRAGNGGLWKYENNAWTRLTSNGFIQDVDVDPTNGQRLVAATNDHPYHDATYASGVWLSEDGGVTWSQQNEGLAMLRIETIRFNPFQAGQLVLGTGGRGFFLGQLRPITVTAAPRPASVAASWDVYPNPAILRRELTVSGPSAEALQYTVLDGLGRICLSGVLPAQAGPRRLDVRRLPAGVYLVRLGQGRQQVARRIVLADK